jgi:xylan 1,4-beta-xylosidase
MFGLMGGERLKAESSGALGLDAMLKAGVKDAPDINALASRRDRELSVLAWNYHDDDVEAPEPKVELTVDNLPIKTGRVLVTHYRVDQRHSNSYTVWKAMDGPQKPTAEQYARLEAAGRLETLGSPVWAHVDGGRLKLDFALPRQAVSLVQIEW